MALEKLRELPWFFQLLILAAIAGLMVVGVEFFTFREIVTANEAARTQLLAVQSDLANSKEIEKRHRSFQDANARLERQLAEMHVVLPTNKETDDFVRQIQDIASRTNVRILRLVAKQVSKRETATPAPGPADQAAKKPEAPKIYNELPFTLELAGGYHGLGMFLDKIAGLQRIINISNMEIATIANPQKIRVKPPLTPGLSDTVVATCTATTFFSAEP